MGGCWECMIGIVKRILDSILTTNTVQLLTHEVLVTLLAEVTTIVNSRPLIPASSDPATLLTQKTGSPPIPPGSFGKSDLYGRQWRQVQHLSNFFWHHWRTQYLPTLQDQRKWQTNRPNIQVGDIVLLKDNQAKRCLWPMGVLINTLPSRDGKVRKVEIKVASGGTCKSFLRPVTETVLLLLNSNECSQRSKN